MPNISLILCDLFMMSFKSSESLVGLMLDFIADCRYTRYAKLLEYQKQLHDS